MNLEDEFFKIISKFAINGICAVAVSGGIDSVVLLHLINQYKNKINKNIKIIVLTVNHGLREEAINEVKFVAEIAANLDINCYILNCRKRNTVTGSVQNWARQERYTMLINWCIDNGASILLTAHHRDDQVETFMMRLERGSGIDGLTAIGYTSFLNEIQILRPLLSFSRDDLLQYALKNNIEWVEDPSNHNVKYQRTLYRKFFELMDNKDILSKRIFLLTQHLQRALNTIKYYTRLAIDECLEFSELGYIKVKLSVFYTLPEEIALRILLYSLMGMNNTYYKPRFQRLNRLFLEIWQTRTFKCATILGCYLVYKDSTLLILRELAAIAPQIINVRKNSEISVIWDNRLLLLIKNPTNHNYDKVMLSVLNNKMSLINPYVNILPCLKINEKILACLNISNDNMCNSVTLEIKKNLLRKNILDLIDTKFVNEESLI